jgi:hypothetical protein
MGCRTEAVDRCGWRCVGILTQRALRKGEQTIMWIRMGLRMAGWIAGVVVCASFPGTGSCGSGRIALLADARVSGDAILLGDLLPKDAPREVRVAVAEVALGNAPRIGSVRRLRGKSVADAMEQAGVVLERFVIPEVIFVERDSRILSSEEILASMHHALGRFSLSAEEAAALRGVSDGDIFWESGLRVPLGDARLMVEDLAVDFEAGLARFRVAVGAEERGLPFEVFARVPARKTATALTTVRAAQTSGRLVLAGALQAAAGKAGTDKSNVAQGAEGPVLVAPGKTARLRLHSENSVIWLDVKALQAGHAGETIRVSVPASGRTLRARVAGVRELEAVF